jgi:hypothetical protein
MINNQTIEPTQVAGFNQFFVDAEGTDAWRYGIAMDQKFSKDLFAGRNFDTGFRSSTCFLFRQAIRLSRVTGRNG